MTRSKMWGVRSWVKSGLLIKIIVDVYKNAIADKCGTTIIIMGKKLVRSVYGTCIEYIYEIMHYRVVELV